MLGLVGGGQLAKMLAQAATQLGCDVAVLERRRPFPADSLDTRATLGDWNDPAVLLPFAESVDVLVFESEFVDAAALHAVERAGHRFWPSAAVIERVQDKLVQKTALRDAGLPVPTFVDTPTQAAVLEAGQALGWPLLLKNRRNGYDGKGNATVKGPGEVDAAWTRLDGDHAPLFAEAFCRFEGELAIIITRGRDGSSVCYPVVETEQRDHICHRVSAPARIDPALAHQAQDIAQRAIAAVDGMGSFGVEMFRMPDGAILINELAPRVHNTGHYTIEACACSQYENHIRAVLGWPLGSTQMRRPAAVMINLLGEQEGPAMPSGWREALGVPGAHLHLYGKAQSKPGRKMGHVTALGDTIEAADAVARRAADLIRFTQGATP